MTERETLCRTQPLAAISQPPGAIQTLQLGMSWFPEQAGNGLDRVYHALIHHLPEVEVGVRGIVAGSPAVAASSYGRVRAFAHEGAPIHHRLRAARREVTMAIRAAPPSLIAAHFALYAAPALDHLQRLPFVMHFHGPWAAESAVEGGSRAAAWTKWNIERAVYAQADRFIVLSAAFRDVLACRYGVDPQRVSVVPGGVDVDRFAPGLSPAAARTRLGLPPERPLVLSVRRLTRRMGLDRLVAAMAIVKEREPEALLLIAGKGPLAAALRAQIAAADLEDHVRLLGFVPEEELPLLYCAADISIVPTVAWEGFGLTTVESLAAGTPVLVTPSGGLPEVVGDLSPGLILPSAEVEDLAEGLLSGLQRPGALPDRAACQAYARHRFSWPRVARDTRAVYEQVLR